MRILCLAKYTPNVNNFKYDYERNVLIRENTSLILNHDDACAIAYALSLRDKIKDLYIEVVSMGPNSIIPLISDIARLLVDKVTVISDKLFAGSDTYVTSNILYKYLKNTNFDLILSGTNSLDGDTAHVPSQVAHLLGIPNMCSVNKVISLSDELDQEKIAVEVKESSRLYRFNIALPCLIGISRDSKYKLPYLKYEDIDRCVDDKINIISNLDIQIDEEKLGLNGSPTKIYRTFIKEMKRNQEVRLKVDEEGIEYVYEYIKKLGFDI